MRKRILIVNVPRMLGDLLKALVRQEEGAKIVGEQFGTVESLEQLQNAVKQTSPDVLVVGREQLVPFGEVEQLLSTYPALRIVALTCGGQTALVYRQRTEKLRIDEVSPGVLLHAVKGFIYPVS